MKKIIALIITVLLISAVSVCAFATEDVVSPTDAPIFNIDLISYDSGVAENIPVDPVQEGDTITLTAPESDGEFVGWTIVGDYELVAGTLEDEVITIRPLSDLQIVANYSHGTTPGGDIDDGDNSPQTGDDMLFIVIAALFVFGGIGCVFAGKKLLAKKN